MHSPYLPGEGASGGPHRARGQRTANEYPVSNWLGHPSRRSWDSCFVIGGTPPRTPHGFDLGPEEAVAMLRSGQSAVKEQPLRMGAGRLLQPRR
jgi:hypothetical protein